MHRGAPRHDWLALTGGAIGQGLPVAVGAAVACPDRPVFALEADGSALYTIQSLWTMAREQLNVTVVIFNNRSYAILNMELARVGAKNAGPHAKAQLDLQPARHRLRADRDGLWHLIGARRRRAEDLVEALEVADRGARAAPDRGRRPHHLHAPPSCGRCRTRCACLERLPPPMAAAVKKRFYP